MNLRRLRDGALALVIGFGLGTVAIEADGLRTLFRAGERLGPLDVFRYCDERWGEDASALVASGDAPGWRCVVRSPIFNTPSIDLDEACTALWDVPAVARNENGSPHGWQCYIK